MSASLDLTESMVPSHLVIRNVRPTLSAMGWGAYSIKVLPGCAGTSGAQIGLVVLPLGVAVGQVVSVLEATSLQCEVGNYFGGRYGFSEAGLGQYVFAPASVCLRLEAKTQALLEIAQVLVLSLGIGHALIIQSGIENFYVIERCGRNV